MKLITQNAYRWGIRDLGINLLSLSQELRYYPFAVKLDRCVGSCDNTLND